MALAKNLKVLAGTPNEINLSWDQPVGFNSTTDELIVTKTQSHFPIELENTTYPTKVTDTIPIEIFRGKVIVGTTTATAVGSLTDALATFSTAPKLTGRLLRDANSRVFKILDNTATSVTLSTALTPASGPYVILADFPQEVKTQITMETDIRTSIGLGFIKSPVKTENGNLVLLEMVEDELANLIHLDGAGVKRVIKSNTSDTIFFFDALTIPVLGSGTFVLNSFNTTSPVPYKDNFKVVAEADARIGTGLLDNEYYYYTLFTKPFGTNVAQATYGAIDSGTPTQASTISVQDRQFGQLLYNYWPGLHRDLDVTEDLKDLMSIFGAQFQELHALVAKYNLQDADNLFFSALPALADQTGLPSVGFSIGADTLRRIGRDMLPCWKLKGSKEGIAMFIKIITTWDITNGTADYAGSVLDFLPNVEALRWFDPNLGTTNTRLTSSGVVVSTGSPPAIPTEYSLTGLPVTGGRFAQSLPGIVIPGFFTFREFVVTLPNIALFIGSSKEIQVFEGNTILIDQDATFGPINSLVGNFVLPNEEEVNDVFEIISNTPTTLTLKGVINNKNFGGKYVVLSPVNKNRFLILNTLLPSYIPFGTQAGFTFVNA